MLPPFFFVNCVGSEQSTPTSSNPISPQLSVTWAFQRDSRSGSAAAAAGRGGVDHDDKAEGGGGARQSVASVEEESPQHHNEQQQQQQRSSSKLREAFGRRIKAKL